MKLVQIVNSSKRRFWYDDQIGKKFRVLDDLPLEKCWLVVASDGYSNVVRYSDGKVTYS